MPGCCRLETPGFAKELSNKKTGCPLATQWRGNKSAITSGITDLVDLRKRGYIVTMADVSLGLPSSLSQESSVPSMGALQTSLYSWYPLTTLNIVNVCTIFRGTRDDEINDCGLFKFSAAHCNYGEG